MHSLRINNKKHMKTQLFISALLLSTIAWSSEIGRNDFDDFLEDNRERDSNYVYTPSKISIAGSMYRDVLTPSYGVDFGTYYRLCDWFSAGICGKNKNTSIFSESTRHENYYLIDNALLDVRSLSACLALRFNIPYIEEQGKWSHYFELNAGARFSKPGCVSLYNEEFSKIESGEDGDYISHWYDITSGVHFTKKTTGDVCFKYTILFEDEVGFSISVGYMFPDIIDKTTFDTPVVLATEWDKFNSYYQDPIIISDIANFLNTSRKLYFQVHISFNISL